MATMTTRRRAFDVTAEGTIIPARTAEDTIIAEARTILALAYASRRDRARGFDTLRAELPLDDAPRLHPAVCEDDAEAVTFWALNRDTPNEPAW